MEPLDLQSAPPRSPYVQIGGLYMLARTIDKVCATLPGGNLGSYRMAGFSAQLLEKLGVSEDALREVVARATSDAAVGSWVREHSNPTQYDAINAEMAEQIIGDRLQRPDFVQRYPFVTTLPPQTTLFQVLDIDDGKMFPKRNAG
ncbi:MAG: DUF5069 domain-containing protein [Candidatus Eremiobacteraeota bacterium]|nr:DUF5069 domain-containing protein [Candidatus Eremiobacteraeota bacterium]MBC5803677.1 DUF5069 domain-containing protein [Candidatus Eremiobacteraeota bacterium]